VVANALANRERSAGAEQTAEGGRVDDANFAEIPARVAVRRKLPRRAFHSRRGPGFRVLHELLVGEIGVKDA